MIDPTGVVSADFWIDYRAVLQSEVESVGVINVIRSVFPSHAFTGVLNDAGTFGDELRCINAPAVYSGLANFDLHRPLLNSRLFCHRAGVIPLKSIRRSPAARAHRFRRHVCNDAHL
jgi:hypothetical protein